MQPYCCFPMLGEDMNDYQEIDMFDSSNTESVDATESTLGTSGGPFLEVSHWVYKPEIEH